MIFYVQRLKIASVTLYMGQREDVFCVCGNGLKVCFFILFIHHMVLNWMKAVVVMLDHLVVSIAIDSRVFWFWWQQSLILMTAGCFDSDFLSKVCVLILMAAGLLPLFEMQDFYIMPNNGQGVVQIGLLSKFFWIKTKKYEMDIRMSSI